MESKKLMPLLIVLTFFSVSFALAQNEKKYFPIRNIPFNLTQIQQEKAGILVDSSIIKLPKYVKLEIPDNLNGRLYYLCKTWGLLKYFSQNNCNLEWDTLLNTTISQVLNSANDTDFNNCLMNMFHKVGNNAYVTNPPAWPDKNLNFDVSWIKDKIFSIPVSSFLDTFSRFIYPSHSSCLVKEDKYAAADFNRDLIKMPINYLKETDRLNAMFYYWNIINYFAPNKYLMDQSWDSTLIRFIPLIRQVNTDYDFHRIFLKMETMINDSHGDLRDCDDSCFWSGHFLPKLFFTHINGKCVLTKFDTLVHAHPGDILTSVNGIDIKKLEDSLSNYCPASDTAALFRNIYRQMMFGQFYSTINFTMLDNSGSLYTLAIPRNLGELDWANWKNGASGRSYYKIKDGFGYINMASLTASQIDDMYKSFKLLPAIIFDLRNYPNLILGDLAKYFFRGNVQSAIGLLPALASDAFNFNYLPGYFYVNNHPDISGTWSNPDFYNGRLFILVNQETQSAAEEFCQYLSYAKNSIVIGTQTAGVDGDESIVNLPGNISASFSSVGWFYADGYQQQRHGVKIDRIVGPTIEGLRQGRDEMLEACFNTCVNIPDTNFRKALIDYGVDVNHDGCISYNECELIKSLKLNAKNINDLTGIEAFINLDSLDCSGNKLSTLSLFSNTSLKFLDCSDNQLTNLDIRNNSLLLKLNCSNNQLKSLDIANCRLLQNLNCSSNQFTNLDLVENSMLLDSLASQGVNLNLSGMPSLSKVCVWEMPFPPADKPGKVDLTGSPNIVFSDSCLSNFVYIPDTNFKKALINLGWDLNHDGQLSYEECQSKTSLDVSNKNIYDLTGISAFTNLTTLICSDNNLAKLDISNLTALSILSCDNNKLDSLLLPYNNKLISLNCSYNRLKNIDVSSQNKLKYLVCNNNSLDSLNVMYNINLIQLNCSSNPIGTLNITRNTHLLDLPLSNGLANLDISHMPALYCVAVWKLPFPPVNIYGTIDTTGSYNVNFYLKSCHVGIINTIDNSSNIQIYPNPAKSSISINLPVALINFEINIYNLNGQLLQTDQLNNSINTVSIKNLSSGVYIIKLKSDKEILVKRFVKQ
jgi:carboxyl-terminal processing protease